MSCCACARKCDHQPEHKHNVCLTHAALKWRPMPRTLAILLALSTACSQPVHVVAAPAILPASMPASQPASMPARVAPYPVGLFRPLDPVRPNGDQVITRAALEALATHTIEQRAREEKKLAACTARERTADDQRDAATAQAQQSAWKATWVPIFTGIGGAAVSAVAVTLIEWALGSLKTSTAKR